MARTKNRGYQQTLAPTYTARLWKMGGYIRLSREDLQKINRGLDDSNSVKNQRDILNDFHFNHAEEFESYTEYVDDGHTGTDTERESFQRLLGDVMNGKITCVVVKDLSRFARNYSDAGSLIDNLFVQMGVRFISLAEGVDSYLNPDSVNSIIVPITNVMKGYCGTDYWNGEIKYDHTNQRRPRTLRMSACGCKAVRSTETRIQRSHTAVKHQGRQKRLF